MEKLRSGILVIFILLSGITCMLLIATDLSAMVLTDLKNEMLVCSGDVERKEQWLLNNIVPIVAVEDNAFADSFLFGDRGFVSDEDIINPADYISTQTDAVLAMETGTSTSASKEENRQSDVAEASAISDMAGINYTMEQIMDYEFLVSNCYTVAQSTSINPDEINGEALMSKDLSIDLSGDEYKILIYHTHGSEAFADSREGATEDTIIGMGDELTRILEEDYGIRVYHDRTVYDMVDGVLDRSYAYDLSREGVKNVLEQYPSIEVIVDLHRDGVREDLHLVRVINGKPTAQIMFFNGVSRLNVNGDIESMDNPNKIDNLAFSLQLHLSGKAKYGDLMRHIYISGYRYNLDLMPRATLIELGAQTNTVEEAKNAMIPLADILYDVLSGQNKVQ